MDQQARDEITAAGAVHRELGPGYDDAVAEGLVERIGEEIDKRVDARLAQYSGQPAPHVPLAQHSAPPAQRSPGGQVSPAPRPPWSVVVLALGSMLMGTLASAAVLNSHGSGASGSSTSPTPAGTEPHGARPPAALRQVGRPAARVLTRPTR